MFEKLVNESCAVIGRINPGNLENVDEYFQFLDKLSKEGVLVNTNPTVISNFGFKDILYNLRESELCDDDTCFYQDFENFKTGFKESLNKNNFRVLKQNYGSTGEGVWLVKLNDDGTINATEAVNNEKYDFDNVDLFLESFEKHFDKTGLEDSVFFKDKVGFVDVRYLPRIVEGEIRVLLIGDKPSLVVHKKPPEGNFSATLFSGAKYVSEPIDSPKWVNLMELINRNIDEIFKFTQGEEFPLVWTLDFILDHDEDKNDKYILSEINCSCVGITTDMDLKENIADELVSMLEKRN